MGTAKSSKTVRTLGLLRHRLHESEVARKALNTLRRTVGADLTEANKRIAVLGETAHNWRLKYNASEQANNALNEALVDCQEDLAGLRSDLTYADQNLHSAHLIYQAALRDLETMRKRLHRAKSLGLFVCGIAISQGILLAGYNPVTYLLGLL